jgi:hypothetical protein
MKILVSGATGLVGKHLIPQLESAGHRVATLVRRKAVSDLEIEWDSERGFPAGEASKLEGFDAVIHLAGDNVASSNWSNTKKRRIRDSRVNGTRLLVEALANCRSKPATFISASATGFYGNRGDEVLTEDSPAGIGFLSEVCQDWETEALKARAFGARVVMLRIGVVLAADGGALEKMLTPFRFGIGGVVGSGRQWMSWIAIEDLIGLIVFALGNERVEGALNATAPAPATNKDFTKTLGKVLNRPTFLPVPGFAIRTLFGEMGESLLLQGNRILPEKALSAGFQFKFADLESAIRNAIG